MSNSIRREKIGQKLFFTGKSAFFFQIFFVFKHPLRCYRNDLVTSTVVVKLPFGPLKTVLRGLSYSIMREKRRQNLFFARKSLFFENICFQQPLRCYRNGLVTPTVIVRTPFGPFLVVTWDLSHSIKREKIGQKLFFTGKTAFLFNFFLFQQPLRCYRIDPVTSTVIVKLPFERL